MQRNDLRYYCFDLIQIKILTGAGGESDVERADLAIAIILIGNGFDMLRNMPTVSHVSCWKRRIKSFFMISQIEASCDYQSAFFGAACKSMGPIVESRLFSGFPHNAHARRPFGGH